MDRRRSHISDLRTELFVIPFSSRTASAYAINIVPLLFNLAVFDVFVLADRNAMQ